jgi:hypothetical protein
MSIFDRRKRPTLTYEQRVLAELQHRNWDGAKRIEQGSDYWYVADEVLFDEESAERFAGFLGRRGKEDVEYGRRAKAAGLSLRKFLVDSGNLPALVDRLRSVDGARREDELSISLNTMLRGEPAYKGGPGGPPAPAQPLDVVTTKAEQESVGVAVLDTGVWQHFDQQPLIAEVVSPDANDIDVLDVDGTVGLDTQACHGTFICGLVAQHAPGQRIDPGLVLDPTGVGDDASIALELAETKAAVVNLSLGGYTQGDRPPLALQQALERLWPDRVVVAAAGNNGSERPFWPAAFKHVIAVGALDTTQQGVVRAKFSNFGPWVDVWAPGVDIVSLYADQQLIRQPVPGFGGWATWSGTSFAAPLVAAEIARRARAGSARVAAFGLLAELPSKPVLNLPGPSRQGLVHLPEGVALA